MAKLSPIGNNAQFINGIPASGAKLFFYAAGSSTKQNTYTDEAGAVPQTNPIILDSRGEPSQPIWLTEGVSYKVVFAPSTDSDPPVSPIWDIDNVTGINDASLTIDQWINSGVTPLYVSATQFTLAGDQTSNFQVNRRVKLLVTAGTVYGYISASAYAALTTVTVVLDSGSLDSGLSSVQLGLITPISTSLRATSAMIADLAITNQKLAQAYINDLTAVTFDPLADYVAIADASDSGNKKKALIPLTSKIQPITATQSGGAITFTLLPTTLDFRSTTLPNGAVTTVSNSANVTLVLPTGGNLGVPTTTQGTLVLIAINNAGTIELAVTNLSSGNPLNESGVITTSIISTALSSYYANNVRTGVAYRVIGFVTSVNTAGAWGNPTLVQGAGGQSQIPIALNAQGNAPMYACRAWVNFNGTGTPAIRSSGNVSSITDNGVGLFQPNFITAMPDIDYCPIGTYNNANTGVAANNDGNVAPYDLQVGSFKVTVINGNSVLIDPTNIYCAVFK